MRISFIPALAVAVAFAAVQICAGQPPSSSPSPTATPNPAASAPAAPVKVPEPPAAEQVAQWAGFDKPVKLAAARRDMKEPWPDDERLGKPIMEVEYRSPKETLVSYTVAIYAKGAALGENRAKMEELIARQEAEMRKLRDAAAKQGDGTDYTKMMKDFDAHVETRPGGRKVFFTPLGFGPGGSCYGAITSMGDYDVLVVELRYDAPRESMPKNPAIPKAGLSEVMLKVEEYLEGKGKMTNDE